MTTKRASAQAPPAPEPFEVLVVRFDHEVVVSVTGEIDVATAPLLSKALAEAGPGTTRRLVIDLHATPFVDSSGLNVFVRAVKRLRHEGAELVLRSPRDNARKVLSVTGLDQVIPIEA